MSRSLPVPTSTWLPTMTGAAVEKYCFVEAGDLDVPALLARARVERHEVVVGRLEEQVVVPHAGAAVADVRAAARLPEVAPQLVAVVRVERPDVVGRRHVEDAVHLQDRALDVRRAAYANSSLPSPPTITGARRAAAAAAAAAATAAARRAGSPPVSLATQASDRFFTVVWLICGQRAVAPAACSRPSRSATSRPAASGSRPDRGRPGCRAASRAGTCARGTPARPAAKRSAVRVLCGSFQCHQVSGHVVHVLVGVASPSSFLCPSSGSVICTCGIAPVRRNVRCVPSACVSDHDEVVDAIEPPFDALPVAVVTATVTGFGARAGAAPRRRVRRGRRRRARRPRRSAAASARR